MVRPEVKAIYQRRVEALLKEVDDEIRRLQSRHNKTGDEITLENDDRFKALQAQQSVVQKKLQALDNASGVVWEELTKEVDYLVKELRTLLNKVSSTSTRQKGDAQR